MSPKFPAITDREVIKVAKKLDKRRTLKAIMEDFNVSTEEFRQLLTK